MLLGSQTRELKERTNRNGGVIASDQEQLVRSSDEAKAKTPKERRVLKRRTNLITERTCDHSHAEFARDVSTYHF